jgi:MFS family permease
LSGAPGAEVGTGRRWSIVALLAAALLINYVDRGMLPTAAPLIQEDLQLSAAQLGLLFSAFYWTYAPMQVLLGWLAEHLGPWRTLAAGLTLWAGATLLVGFAHSLLLLLILRLLLGVGESVGFPSVSKVLAATIPLRDLGTANGLVAFNYLIGPALGAYFGGLLMAGYGWRAAFLVFGAASLLWLVPWARLRPREHARRASASEAPSFLTVLRQPALWGASLGHFSSNYVFYFILTWLPYYLVRERGFSISGMAVVSGCAYLVNAASALIAGWTIDRYIARRGHATLVYKGTMVAGQLAALVCMPLIALGSPPLALACLFVYQILTGVASPGIFAIPQILAGPHAAARWVGIQNALGNVAGILAPALTGLLVESSHHFASAFAAAALVGVLGLLGWTWMLPAIAPLRWPVAPDRSGHE